MIANQFKPSERIKSLLAPGPAAISIPLELLPIYLEYHGLEPIGYDSKENQLTVRRVQNKDNHKQI